MLQFREKTLQISICQYVNDHGWQWTAPSELANLTNTAGMMPITDAKGYDKELGFFPEDIFVYLKTTQEDEWLKLFPAYLTRSEVVKAEAALLRAIAKAMDAPFKKNGGLINVLQNEFSYTYNGVSVRFRLAQFAPDGGGNTKLRQRYDANILRVIHEVEYSQHKKDRIDLVFFLNGFPVFTMELKDGIHNTYVDAMHQYRTTRTPEAETAQGQKIPGKFEPLLHGHRAIAHFAVDLENVYMTTKLEGAHTVFLPFNQGGHPDNPAWNPDNGSAPKTAYLWEEILHRHTFLNILKSFVTTSTREVRKSTGARAKIVEEITFPRYHQYFGDTLALAVTLREGPGGASLLMWSAGAGKSNGIGWLAHCLNSLHYESIPYKYDNLPPRMQKEVAKYAPQMKHKHASGKMFTGGGFVITDRTNLDSQLAGTVTSVTAPTGVVVHIGKGKATSKSKELREELLKAGSSIKITTIQTFPHILSILRQLQEEESKTGQATAAKTADTYFIIRDEAHASEGGKNTQALIELLNAEEYKTAFSAARLNELREQVTAGEILEEELEVILLDEKIRATQKSRADRNRISYFAFTATPKAETLKMFGRAVPSPDDDSQVFVPLHVYGMSQAVAENFIIDPTKNYITHEVITTLSVTDAAGNRIVNSSQMTPALKRLSSRHGDVIHEKTKIVLDHWKDTAFPSLHNNKAQAMVFTSSREEAVAWKHALDEEAYKNGWNVRTLVAFSGELLDKKTGLIQKEGDVNGTGSRDVATVFEKEEYHILVVANKYQTGYDNPRLVAAYVDKPLHGIEAVQCLSRLNRIAPALGKTSVYVLDFVNDAEDIFDAFSAYLTTVSLEDHQDPNALNNLERQIVGYGFYTPEELEKWNLAYSQHHHNECGAITTRVKSRIIAAEENLIQREDRLGLKDVSLYPSLLHRYVEHYGFHSILADLQDTQIEKQALFYSDIFTALQSNNAEEGRSKKQPNLDGIGIVSTRIRQRENKDRIIMPVEPMKLNDMKDASGQLETSGDYVQLKALVNLLNTRFLGIDGVEKTDIQAFIEMLINRVLSRPELMKLARGNSEVRFVRNTDTQETLGNIITGAYASYSSMVLEVMKDEPLKENLKKHTLQAAWEKVHSPGDAS